MNKKKVIIAAAIVVAVIIVVVCIIKLINYKKNNPDVSNAKRGAVTGEDVAIYAKPKESKKKMEDMVYGESVYILDTITKESKGKTQEWYKVREVFEKKDEKGEVKKTYNRVGYILRENVKYFEPDTESEYVLMSDVSKFDVLADRFKTAEDYQAFLLNSNINYAYIRMGGRGYGSEGNFYTDPNYQFFIDACNYLGVPFGLYYVDEALNDEELDEEVEFVKKFINNLDEDSKKMLCLPVAIDVEKYDKGIKARTKDIWKERGELLQKLTEKFKENDIDTIIYSSANAINKYLDGVDAVFWLAYYRGDNVIPKIWVADIVIEDDDSDKNNENDNENDNNDDTDNEEDDGENNADDTDEEKDDEDGNEDDNEDNDDEDQPKYKHFTENKEMMEKVVAWQFTSNGAKEDGIKLKADLSLVKNSFFSKWRK